MPDFLLSQILAVFSVSYMCLYCILENNDFSITQMFLHQMPGILDLKFFRLQGRRYVLVVMFSISLSLISVLDSIYNKKDKARQEPLKLITPSTGENANEKRQRDKKRLVMCFKEGNNN